MSMRMPTLQVRTIVWWYVPHLQVIRESSISEEFVALHEL